MRVGSHGTKGIQNSMVLKDIYRLKESRHSLKKVGLVPPFFNFQIEIKRNESGF